MTKKEFFKKVTNSKGDYLQDFINLLKDKKISFCVIGGFGVNAYTEPVVTLDLDVVVAIEKLESFLKELKRHYKIEKHKHSINIYSKKSDLRIQIQIDPEFQSYLHNAKKREVLGYKLPVASIEDLLKSKIIAVMDKTRRISKRKKDEADILRLIEVRKDLKKLLPKDLKDRLFPTNKNI